MPSQEWIEERVRQWGAIMVDRLRRHNPNMPLDEAERIAREVLSDPGYVISGPCCCDAAE